MRLVKNKKICKSQVPADLMAVACTHFLAINDRQVFSCFSPYASRLTEFRPLPFAFSPLFLRPIFLLSSLDKFGKEIVNG